MFSSLVWSTHILFFGSTAEGESTSPLGQRTVMDSSERVQTVDLLQYTPLGGVFYYNVFHLPPQAHQVNGWEIRQVNRKGVSVLGTAMPSS